MAFEGISAGAADNPIGARTRRGANRSLGRRALLIGTSILVYAAVPSAAMAQNECGPPPPGGGTVNCPPALNPYPNGITYNGVVDDLTVVLEPTVVVTDTVQVTSNSPYADLRIEGATDTSITTTISGSPGISIDAGHGTVYVAADSVSTTQSFSRGISADSSDGTTVFVNDVTTLGKYSAGVVATVTGPTFATEGQPLVTVDSGTISTSGKYSDGIIATNPLGAVVVTSDSIHTTGVDSDGITANARDNVTITSGAVVTTSTRSTGIDATSTVGDITIVSGTIQTGGTLSPGINANAPAGSIDITSTGVITGAATSPGIRAVAPQGNVTISSGSVQTAGANSAGIYASGANRVTVTSGTVVTSGDNSPGIDARQAGYTPPDDGDPPPCEGPECEYVPEGIVAPRGGPAGTIGVGPGVTITSTSMTTTGNHSPGINGVSADGFVQVTSGTLHTSGDYSTGIIANAFDDVKINSTSVITEGYTSPGINAYSQTGSIDITSGTVSTADDYSTGITAFSPAGDIVIHSTSVTTQGYESEGIHADSFPGSVDITSGSVSTAGDYSIGISAIGTTLVNITSTTVNTTGNYSAGISATQRASAPPPPPPPGPPSGDIVGPAEAPPGFLGVFINSGTIHTTGDYSDGIDATAHNDVDITSTSITTEGYGSVGIDAVSDIGTISITSGSVITLDDYADGILAFTSGTGAITINSTNVSTSGYDSDGISGRSTGGPVTINSGNVTTRDDYSTGIFANSGAGAVNVTSTGTVSTGGYESPGIIAVTSGNAPVTVISGTVNTVGDYSAGITARSNGGTVSVTSTSVHTQGDYSPAIYAATSATGTTTVTSGSVYTEGFAAPGIIAVGNNVTVGSTSAITTNDYSTAIVALANTNAAVTSGTVRTDGDHSAGILAIGDTGTATVGSTAITTNGDYSGGLFALAEGNVVVTSGTIHTLGHDSPGLFAYSVQGNITVTSGTVTTARDDSFGIRAGSDYYGVATPIVAVTSTSVTTAGANSPGIYAFSSTNVAITSGTVSTSGANSTGITGIQTTFEPYECSDCVSIVGPDAPHPAPPPVGVTIGSGSVTTLGANSDGIFGYSRDGFVHVTSTGAVNTTGNDGDGIVAVARNGDATVASGTVNTRGNDSVGIGAYGTTNVVVTSTAVTTLGANSNGITAMQLTPIPAPAPGPPPPFPPLPPFGAQGAIGVGPGVTVTSGAVTTSGANSTGIFGMSQDGFVQITSASVTTSGANSPGINAQAAGDVLVTSGPVTTSGALSRGIYAHADGGNATVTSTGTIRTGGNLSVGIYAAATGRVTITSGTVITTGDNSTGIVGVQFTPSADEASITGGAAALGPNGGVSITSGSVTTSGSNSSGIAGMATTGDVEIFSNGTITTTGFLTGGISALSTNGSVTIDANVINATGAGGGSAIFVQSGTTSTVTIRGLVQSTTGFEVFAFGGATTVNTTASGIIRGQVSLTGNADRVNNAGTFDAIGTSFFGAGTDIFTNTNLVTSFNGAAVFAALETFNNSGRVDMRDGSVGDTLNVTGTFTGSGASRLQLDANISSRVADVLITGVSNGSTVMDVVLIGQPVFDLIGTLVVDGTAGTIPTAFTLASTATTSPYVKLNLLFDAPNNNFLLVGLPDQPVFETIAQAEMITEFWYRSADAISAQLEAARDGLVPGGTTTVGNLAGDGGFSGWVQVLGGNIERDTSQSFTNGGNTNVFDTSYEQDFLGVQGGFDYQSGGTILGVSFGLGKSDAEFEQTLNQVNLDGYNVGAYAAFNSGSFFFNAIGKVDWVDVDSTPGAGILAEFDATAWGLRGTAGFRFDMNNVYLEPSASLSWVNVDIDNYTSNGATIAFDDFTSLRGALGVRFGGDFRSGNGIWSPFVGIYAIDEFEGDARSNFILGQTVGLQQDAPGTFGELTAGLNYSTGRLEAFVRGELDFGKERDGLSGRAGVRIRF